MTKILVITSLPDPHVSMVERFLPKDVQLEVYDPRQLSLTNGVTIFQDCSISLLNKEKPLSVWYRKPKFLSNEIFENMHIPRDYFPSMSSMNTDGYSTAFATYPECLWVSDPYAIRRASNKLLQLSIAKTFGFDIPITIFSSNSEDVQNFRSKVGDIVMKSLGCPYANISGTDKWFYTTLIAKTHNVNYEGLSTTPMIFQEKIIKEYDLRVTVIGSRVFGCQIKGKDLDCRKTPNSKYIPLKLNKHLVKKCIKITKHLGLNFGAFDFVKSTNGKLYFLEINPNGQWGFIEEKTGLPLSKSMADLLTNSS